MKAGCTSGAWRTEAPTGLTRRCCSSRGRPQQACARLPERDDRHRQRQPRSAGDGWNGFSQPHPHQRRAAKAAFDIGIPPLWAADAPLIDNQLATIELREHVASYLELEPVLRVLHRLNRAARAVRSGSDGTATLGTWGSPRHTPTRPSSIPLTAGQGVQDAAPEARCPR